MPAVRPGFRLTRFAPAPTGFLHLGHVANAMFVWGLARAYGADVLLRIEDHDRERCRAEYERALLDDLDWLGFARSSESRQSDRGQLYAEAARGLTARGLVYGCTCARQPRYPGTCRERGIKPESGVAWRLRLEPGIEVFDDLLCGHQEQDPASESGDVAIRDRLGNWTYQFVVSVDDALQGIDLVVRGRDLLDSTGRQIRIARLIGRTWPATFAHHGLIMKTPSQKLSKSDRDTGIPELRAAGWTRGRVIAEAARQVGLASREELSSREAIDLVASLTSGRD
jgi:glutamyl-tRNA synthetase/glutamyl-Q tRNA(Asp) synthetase